MLSNFQKYIRWLSFQETQKNSIKDKKEFLRGAEIAYESVLTAFASEDLIKLKNLLSPNMFTNFSDAIKLRNKEGIKSEFTFIGVKGHL